MDTSKLEALNQAEYEETSCISNSTINKISESYYQDENEVASVKEMSEIMSMIENIESRESKDKDIFNILELYAELEKETYKQKEHIEKLEEENKRIKSERDSIAKEKEKLDEKYVRDVERVETDLRNLIQIQANDIKLKNSKKDAKNVAVANASTSTPPVAKDLKTSPFLSSKLLKPNEEEYKRKINQLEKQVRTLQRLHYHKEPPETSNKINKEDSLSLAAHIEKVNELEKRAEELELQNTSLKSLEEKHRKMSKKHEGRIQELEDELLNKNDESRERELEDKVEKFKNEIMGLRGENNRLKREVELLNMKKKKIGGAEDESLGFALKSFKLELKEKEKEIIRLKKELAEAKKTNLGLKKEREKYLLVPAKSPHGQSECRPVSSIPKPDAKPEVLGLNSNGFFKEMLETERREFVEVETERRRVIEEKCRKIRSLEEQIFELEEKNNDSELLSEYRSRLLSQIQLITELKERLCRTQKELGERTRESRGLEFRVRQLSQELSLAKTTNKKSENEILCDLVEQISKLRERYSVREKRIESLTNELGMRNLAVTNGRNPSTTTTSYFYYGQPLLDPFITEKEILEQSSNIDYPLI